MSNPVLRAPRVLGTEFNPLVLWRAASTTDVVNAGGGGPMSIITVGGGLPARLEDSPIAGKTATTNCFRQMTGAAELALKNNTSAFTVVSVLRLVYTPSSPLGTPAVIWPIVELQTSGGSANWPWGFQLTSPKTLTFYTTSAATRVSLSATRFLPSGYGVYHATCSAGSSASITMGVNGNTYASGTLARDPSPTGQYLQLNYSRDYVTYTSTDSPIVDQIAVYPSVLTPAQLRYLSVRALGSLLDGT